jgi:hypothetical protein
MTSSSVPLRLGVLKEINVQYADAKNGPICQAFFVDHRLGRLLALPAYEAKQL